MINTVTHFFFFFLLVQLLFLVVVTETNLSCSDSSSFLTVERQNIHYSNKSTATQIHVTYAGCTIYKKTIKMLLHFLFKLVSTL